MTAFFQVASIGVLIVAALIIGGVMPLSSIAFMLPRGFLESEETPLPPRRVTAAIDGDRGAGGGGGSGPDFGYGAGVAAQVTDEERDGRSPGAAAVSTKGASRDPGCDSEGELRRLAGRYPEWSRPDLALIACDRVRLGFTAEQVQASRGRPLRRQTASGAAAEVWIYRDIRVVLERDRVVSIRE